MLTLLTHRLPEGAFTPSEHAKHALSQKSNYGRGLYQEHIPRIFIERTALAPLSDALIYDLVTAACDTQSQEVAASRLRVLRKCLMLSWIWREALFLDDLETITHEISAFADASLLAAQEVVNAHLAQKYGLLTGDRFIILAMGKLGGMELNLSSDIDLVFLHKTKSHTQGARSISSQKYMTALARGIIALLDNKTPDGFVWRVDMRLRPWGEGSALVMDLPAFDKYLQNHARTWERFAYLRARVVGGECEAVQEILDTFIYRYYIDYSAFAALREMRELIHVQTHARDDVYNVKLSSGGIRDIEFIVQSFLLIYAGHNLRLKAQKTTLNTIRALVESDLLSKEDAQVLARAYRYLRGVEHGIQAMDDIQSACVFLDEDKRTRLFRALNTTQEALRGHQLAVSEVFLRLVGQNNPHQITHYPKPAHDLVEQMQPFWAQPLVKNLAPLAKQRLKRAYDVILFAIDKEMKAQGTCNLDAVTTFLNAICRRSIYLVMLSEHPEATLRLIALISRCPWCAQEISNYPVLIDTILQGQWAHLPDQKTLIDRLKQALLRVPVGDDERLMSVMRLFKKSMVLATAAADILEACPVMKVSDSLTHIAEACVIVAMRHVFESLLQRHGAPLLKSGVRAGEDLGLAIIGYGKLGGIELSYTSDLDLVFLHNVNPKAMTDGSKPIPGMHFVTRFVQRFMTLLSTQTRDGRVYEIDVRLRPSGVAGVMVVSLEGFWNYQHEKAWVWEHQALVRARAIAGDTHCLMVFEYIRKTILCAQDIEVKDTIIQMRKKMHDQKAPSDDIFDLKHSKGGMVDIEFMAQYLVLKDAKTQEDLAVYSDNVRIFLASRKTIGGLADVLIDSYLTIRALAHRLSLSKIAPKIATNTLTTKEQKARQNAIDAWIQIFGTPY